MATRMSAKQLRPLLVLIAIVVVLWLFLSPRGGGGTGNTDRSGQTAPTTAPTSAPQPRASARPRPTAGSGRGLWEIYEEAQRRRDAADAERDRERRDGPGRSDGRDRDHAGMPAPPGRSPDRAGAARPGPPPTPATTATTASGSTGRAPGTGAPVTGGAAIPADADRILLVLDASGSMARRAGRTTSMGLAQEGLVDAAGQAPVGTPLGLRAFGSRVDGYGRPSAAACRDTVLVAPIAPLDHAKMERAIRSLRPLGETPIVRSLAAAVDDLGPTGRRSILLVTDGEESCHPDPCAAVAQARDEGADVRVDIVGLQVGAGARRQLTCIADRTGGRYWEARRDSETGPVIREALDRLRVERTGRQQPGSWQASGAPTAAAAMPGPVDQQAAASQPDGGRAGLPLPAALAIGAVLLALIVIVARR